MPIDFAEPPAGRNGGLPSLLSDEEWEDIRQARLRNYAWSQIYEAIGRRFATVRSLENSYHNHFRRLADHVQVRPRNLCTLPIEGDLTGAGTEDASDLLVEQAGDAGSPSHLKRATG